MKKEDLEVMAEIYLGPAHPPNTRNFRIVPKDKPNLIDLFTDFNWNSVDKTFWITIKENSMFEGYLWFESIRISNNKAKTNAFENKDNNFSLFFFNNDQQEIAGFKFSNLELLEHSLRCSEFITDRIVHEISLSYEDCKMLFTRNEKDDDLEITIDDGERIDKEWKAPVREIK